MTLDPDPSTATPTKIVIPTRERLPSEDQATLQSLLVRLVADVPLGTLSPEERRVVALVETRPF
jgi:hypothetical protein